LERVAKQAIRDWINRKQKEYWKSTDEQKHKKGFLQETSTKRTREISELTRHMLRL
jgi:hypothetical protein